MESVKQKWYFDLNLDWPEKITESDFMERIRSW